VFGVAGTEELKREKENLLTDLEEYLIL